MADKKKTSSGRKSSSGNKSSSSGKKSSSGNKKSGTGTKNSASRFSWESEVALFVVLAFCVILFVANIGRAGSLGSALARFFFGLFGVMSYVFPFALFLLAAFLISNRTEGRNSKYQYPGRAVIKSLAGVICFVFVCVVCSAVYFRRSSFAPRDLYNICSSEKAGGGVIGGCIGQGMIRGIGFAPAILISFIILALCVVLISERSLFRRVSRKIYSSRDESIERQEKRLREDDEYSEPAAKRTRRSDRKVTGVMQDVELRPVAGQAESKINNSERMSELDLSAFNEPRGFVDESAEITSVKPNIYIPGQENTAEIEIDTITETGSNGSDERKKKSSKPKAGQSMQEVTSDTDELRHAMTASTSASHGDYIFPNIRLLRKGDPKKSGDSRQHLQQMSARLQETLETFGVNARVTNVVCGPAVTQYEVQPEMGVKVSKILGLADDIKLNLMVSDIRIEAPIPGKAAIGIEVPNKENVTVALRDLIESGEFQNERSNISFCVGKDIAGHVIVADIAKMPHLLIAGATGSGKSVCINTIIMSILFKASPDEVKLIMIDPKVVELSVYNNIPHLLIPVVTDPKKAAGALHWAVAEMTERYNKFAEYGVRDIEGYNKKVDSIKDIEDESKPQRMPSIVIIVDELADLMMVAAGDVEDAICRLAQLARAAGLHLIIATQRPSVNVITGLIKANMPSRIAFSVTSGVDSRTILDMNGAEKLLGKGDMLFYPQGYAKPLRVQGAFVSDTEVAKVVDDIVAKNGWASFDSDIQDSVATAEASFGAAAGFPSTEGDRDVYFADAARYLIEKEKGSIGMLQRNFKIGFNRAARIMDQLEEAGVVGPEEGTKPRRVLMTLEEFENMED